MKCTSTLFSTLRLVLLALLCCGIGEAKLGSLQSTLSNVFSQSNTLLKNIRIPQNQVPPLLKSYVGQTIEKSVHSFNKRQRILSELRAVADDTFQLASSYYGLANQGLFDDNDAVTDILIKWMLKYPNTVQFGIYSYAMYSVYRYVPVCAPAMLMLLLNYEWWCVWYRYIPVSVLYLHAVSLSVTPQLPLSLFLLFFNSNIVKKYLLIPYGRIAEDLKWIFWRRKYTFR